MIGGRREREPKKPNSTEKHGKKGQGEEQKKDSKEKNERQDKGKTEKGQQKETPKQKHRAIRAIQKAYVTTLLFHRSGTYSKTIFLH